MIPSEQVISHALTLAGEITPQQRHILEMLCITSASTLKNRLREGVTVEDCGADFVNAASLMALAALAGAATDTPTEQFTAGDFTIRKGSVSYDAVAESLRTQAEQIMVPYLKDRFLFQGV